MPGIAISELIRYDCTDGLNESLIPISVNGNTYGIKSSVFLNDLNNCLRTTINCVEQQGCTIITCMSDTSTLCNSIQCNETDITNIKQEVINIKSQITEIDGRVDLTSTLDDCTTLNQLITNNTNCINNNASQITTLNGCIDTINEDLSIKASASQVNTLENCLNSANSSIENLNTCTTNLQGQINTLDVAGQAMEFDCLSNKVTQNESSITNLCNTTTDLQGSISTINNNLDAKASASTVSTLQSDLDTTEGNITSLQTCSTKFDNCITSIEGDLETKANASAVGSISSALNTAQGNITSLQSCTTTLQSSINSLDVGNQTDTINQLQTDLDAKASASTVSTLQSDLDTTEGNITSLQTCSTKFDNCITSIEGDLETKANASAVGSISSALNTAQGNITSLQSCTTTLQNSINNIDVGSQASAISQLQTDVSTANNCITQSKSDITTLNTSVNTLTNKVNTAASDVSTLESTVNGFDSSISTACTLATNACKGVTSLESKYGIRVNANGAIAGFGILACGNTSSGCRTKFCIQSNCFVLEDQSGCGKIQPFVVENNKVRMCGACIKSLSVDTLQIGEQAISSCEFTKASNKTYTTKANTCPQCTLPFGDWQNRATATIVSAGCPTIINFGYSGSLEKTTRTKCYNVGGFWTQNHFCTTTFKYCLQIRVTRNGTPITASSNNQFIDTSPPAGNVTYALQSRMFRDYNVNIVCQERRKSGGRSSRANGGFTYKNGEQKTYNLKTVIANNTCKFRTAGLDTSTQTLTLKDPFIEIRQAKR